MASFPPLKNSMFPFLETYLAPLADTATFKL